MPRRGRGRPPKTTIAHADVAERNEGQTIDHGDDHGDDQVSYREPLRELRLRAKLAGVRVQDWHDPEFLLAEIDRLGEFESEDKPYKILETAHDMFVAEMECGLICMMGHDGFFKIDGKLNGRHGFDSFRDSLDLVALAADAYFDTLHEWAVRRHDETIVEMEQEAEFDGAPPGPTPEELRIVKFADEELGVRNCNFVHSLLAVANAYGLPLGESRDPKEVTDEVRRPDNAGVMYDQETLKAHVLKAMEKPL